jgi:hypothetical protein
MDQENIKKKERACTIQTKRRVRAFIRISFYSVALLGLAGFLISFSTHFAAFSIVCLLGFFLFGSVALDLELRNHGSKHWVAHSCSIPTAVLATWLCAYLWSWNKNRPPDMSQATYVALTNLGSRVEKGIAQSGPRQITKAQKESIRRIVSPCVQISIMPLMPGEPEEFANALGAAFSDAGAQAAVGSGNMIMDGTEGLRVRYDHSDPKCKSVFSALDVAGLNPVDNGDAAGNRIVLIRVAPKAR